MGLADRLGHVCPLSLTSASSPAACLQGCSAGAWCRGSREADAMIEACVGMENIPACRIHIVPVDEEGAVRPGKLVWPGRVVRASVAAAAACPDGQPS
jgi:hypothetical protein